MDWRRITNEKEKYHAYLCSPEWGKLRKAIRVRSGGICERCQCRKMDAVHHLTYIRKYKERLTDLQAICNTCHEVTHGLDEETHKPTITCYLAGKRCGQKLDVIDDVEQESSSWPFVVRFVASDLTSASGEMVLWDKHGCPTDSVPHYSGLFENGTYTCESGNLCFAGDHDPINVGDWQQNNPSSLAMKLISMSDCMAVIAENDSAYGTIAELAYWKAASGRPSALIVFGEPYDPDLFDAWRFVSGFAEATYFTSGIYTETTAIIRALCGKAMMELECQQ